MASASAVIVFGDPEARQALANLLVKQGLVCVPASTAKEVESILVREAVSLILCSEELPDGGFRDVLRQAARALNKVPVIVFSRLADWERYLNILRTGAFDYVLYPSVRGEIERIVRNALSPRQPEPERAKQVASAA